MNFNTDGFNDRKIYIHNSNDRSKITKNGPSNIDSSFAKMRIRENRPDINTVNRDLIFKQEEVKGNRDNFILRTNNIRNVNSKVNPNNPVNNAMNMNKFKKF